MGLEVIALLLWLQMESALGVRPIPAVVGMAGASRTYHRVTVAQLATTKWTHVSVCGRVAFVQPEADGDMHLRLEDGAAFIVVEVVPYHPLPRPARGARIRVDGISRIDKTHAWPEIHPAEAWRAVSSCGAP